MADALEGMLQHLPQFTRALRFRHERMEAAAQSGYLNAMAAATYLVHKGVPFRTAHEKIGNAVRYALEKGVELGDLTHRRTAPIRRRSSAKISTPQLRWMPRSIATM